MRQAASLPHGAEQALSGWRRPEQRGRMLGMRTTPDPYGGFRFPATNALRKMLAAARLQVHLDEVLSGSGQAPSRCQ